MLKKVLGQTRKEISIMGFGCMRLPQNSASAIDIDLEQTEKMLRLAIARGVNYVDTAYPYHGDGGRLNPGRSEPVIGEILAKDGLRDKVHLATKLPTWLMDSKKKMHDTLDLQLKRLRTDHVDFYLAHNLIAPVWAKIRSLGLLEFFDEALKDGRIKHAGFSFHDEYSLFEEIVSSYDWSLAQIQYNYLDTEYQAGRKGAELARKKGLGLVVMEPLRGGYLVNCVPDALKAKLARIRPEWSLADWGLRWLWEQPEVGVVLSGVSTLAQTEENLKIADTAASLSDREREALAEVRSYFLSRIKVDCTGCGYCLPCSSGVNIPKVFSYYNNYYIIDSDEARARVQFMYTAQVGSAERPDNCVHCGECEEKCPQHLTISERMKEVLEVFPAVK